MRELDLNVIDVVSSVRFNDMEGHKTDYLFHNLWAVTVPQNISKNQDDNNPALENNELKFDKYAHT